MSVAFAMTKEERSAELAEGRGAYYARLVQVLGNGADWEYHGECSDLGAPVGVCSCGHTGLRYLFYLAHKSNGRQAIVGSTCIGHFSEARPELVASIQADANRLHGLAQESLTKARLLTFEQDIARRLAEFSDLAWSLDRQLAQYAKPFDGFDYCGRPRIYWRATRRVARDVFFGWHPADQAAERVAQGTDRVYPLAWRAQKSRAAFKRQIEEAASSTTFVASCHLGGWLAGPLWEGGAV